MLEFKLNYYFNKYKDTICFRVAKFKEEFIKQEGEFELLNELVIMIQKYQHKRYGDLISDGMNTLECLGNGVRNQKENCRNRNRFGTKEERIIRKWVLK